MKLSDLQARQEIMEYTLEQIIDFIVNGSTLDIDIR
jgi:hypothetical protein